MGTLKTYTAGFALSIILTLIPFAILINHWIHGWAVVFTLFGFAVAQLLVQLQFFIHLGHETGPRWNMMMFLSMLLVVLIVVIGSLWIMDNLDYHMMSPDQTEEYIQNEEGIHH